MNLQMLKKAMLAYVSAVKFIWSSITYPLSIVGKKLMNLRGYRIYGKSVQDGTPTPETPIEIENVGDLSTKNLLDIDTFNTTAATSHIKYNKTTGIITCNTGLYGRYVGFHSNIETLKAGTYTMSCEVLYDPVSSPYNSTMYMGVCGYDENGTRKDYKKVISVSDAITWTKKTVTINVETDIDMSDASSYGIGIEIQPAGNAQKYTGLNLQIRNIMIAEGDVNDDYEPYHKYKIPVVARGRNLFDGSSSEGAGQYLKVTGEIGSGNANLRVTDYITIPSGASSLTFSFKGEVMNYPSMCLYDENKQYITGKMYSGSTKPSISVPSNAKYVRCSYRTVNTDIQLEGGSTKTGYEPYIAPVTTNIFLDEPLRKVGDYADYVDFEKQKIVRNVYQYNLSEISALGSFNDKTTYWYGYWLIREPYPISINKLKIISDKFKCIYPRNADVEDTYLSNDVPPYDSAMYYSVEKKYCPEVETIAEMLDWLRGTNADLFYVLATPIEETVNLPVLPQFKGTTIYEVGTNIKPSGMEAKYC